MAWSGQRKLLVAIVAIALVAVAIGGGIILLNSKKTTPPPGPAPKVTFTTPANGATSVAINTKILATFSTAMNPSSITKSTFTLKHGSTSDSGVVTYTGLSATLAPKDNLNPSTKYTATITTGAKDVAGHKLATNYVWNFTVGVSADTVPPHATAKSPVVTATLNSNLSVTFSEPMDPSTISASTFTLKQGTTAVAGTVTYIGLTATFNPTNNLAASTNYTATITTGARDLAGNGLASNFVWSFETGTTTARGPSPVYLGTAGGFAILAKTGVSTTGTTAVTGNIGLSPAAESYITGFALTNDASNTFATSSLVTGKVYAADMTAPTPTDMTTAIGDMQIAFTDAAGRVLPDATELGAGDISGMTLAPGLYKWGSGLSINTEVTLSGGANDVWIFQIAQDLTVANGAIVHLSGGAQAKNIFWQVSGQATLGTTSDVSGIILCQTQIVLKTGATLDGRALAQSAVTLDASTVTQPA